MTPAGDPFAKVRTGEAFRPQARAWNDMLDAALAHKGRAHSVARVPARDPYPSSVVPIVNEAGVALPQYAVVGVAGVLPTPDNPPADDPKWLELANRITLRGTTPDASHRGKFAVLLEGCDQNQVVPAAIDGIVLCQVEAADAGAEPDRADVVPGQYGYLGLSHWGGARVLWRETGAGVKWAVVQLGVQAPAAPIWGWLETDLAPLGCASVILDKRQAPSVGSGSGSAGSGSGAGACSAADLLPLKYPQPAVARARVWSVDPNVCLPAGSYVKAEPHPWGWAVDWSPCLGACSTSSSGSSGSGSGSGGDGDGGCTGTCLLQCSAEHTWEVILSTCGSPTLLCSCAPPPETGTVCDTPGDVIEGVCNGS